LEIKSRKEEEEDKEGETQIRKIVKRKRNIIMIKSREIRSRLE
jgi:hypothetical protein